MPDIARSLTWLSDPALSAALEEASELLFPLPEDLRQELLARFGSAAIHVGPCDFEAAAGAPKNVGRLAYAVRGLDELIAAARAAGRDSTDRTVFHGRPLA